MVTLTREQIDALVATTDGHRDRDELVAGTYRKIDRDGWRGGCHIGCAIHDLRKLGVLPETVNYSDHESLAVYTGIPEQVLYMWDAIFEGLDDPERLEWPSACARTLRPGVNWELVWPRFALWLLAGHKRVPDSNPVEPVIAAAIADATRLYEQWVQSGVKPERWLFEAVERSTIRNGQPATLVTYISGAAYEPVDLLSCAQAAADDSTNNCEVDELSTYIATCVAMSVKLLELQTAD